DLPLEVFTASDSLGWVYQFWQAKRKDEINKSEVKIGARELPAVTQLFTEPYMVSFLLDNSLGAWWAARRLTETDLATAETELELRQKASLPGMPLEYLRFIRKEGESKWSPASGSFPGWPEHLADFKMLDPCCGSGHFLVAILSMLVPMRMTLEGLTAREATDLVLSQNIHGLEIDKRCVELAAFNLALAAWKYPEAGGYRILPELNIACTGIGPQCSADQWTKLAEQSGLPMLPDERERIKNGLMNLHRLFLQAPTLGSLIDPKQLEGDVFAADYETIQPYLAAILNAEKADDEALERAIAAAGMVKAADLLADEYTLVVTNVPYLSKGKFNSMLLDFCDTRFGDSKSNLAACFVQRSLVLLSRMGSAALVSMQTWLFQISYSQFRKRLLRDIRIDMVAALGARSFRTQLWDFAACLLVLSNSGRPLKHRIHTVSVENGSDAESIPQQLLLLRVDDCTQDSQFLNPDCIWTFSEYDKRELLGEVAECFQGIKTGDDGRVRRFFWELVVINNQTRTFQSTLDRSDHFGGLRNVLFWADEGEDLARRQGMRAWGRLGVAISQMSSLPCAIYLGEAFDSNMAALVPKKREHASAIMSYCQSNEFTPAVRAIDKALKPTNSCFHKIPFDLAHWTEVAAEKYPNGLPKPYTDDPTQWIFHGHPCGSVVWSEETKWTAFGTIRVDSSVLHVAVARLLGYRWPAELDPKMELSEESRALVAKCDELLGFGDKDGIVSIPAHRGEPSVADRLVNLLAAAYGKEWSNDRLMQLLANADHAGKTLESWLRDKFFAQHCAMFHQKPFIWHIWDGLKDGFSVLVNYHKLDRKNLETLIYSYLGDWITRQRQEVASGIDGAQDKLAAAEQLKKRLELIQEGEAPYDIFVRWKPLEKQPIGWDPDINDGVRLNIRPFVSVPDVGKKGAGVLREKPRIHWEKDRGKDVQSAPWFHLFKGDRINDHHLTLEQKKSG
ncbi:MAG: N-6 DNA methylase, partial [Acidobacteria bacterium]|nr:N-6 DNA methylase [Acidobacteriota bacterium]